MYLQTVTSGKGKAGGGGGGGGTAYFENLANIITFNELEIKTKATSQLYVDLALCCKINRTSYSTGYKHYQRGII